MTIRLYNYTGETNALYKDLDPDYDTITGFLRENTSLLNPSIVIEYGSVNDVFSYNYAYIENLDRYYFITDIISLGNNLWRVDMKEDVLETYNITIGEQYALIDRNDQDYNEMIEDNMLNYEYRKSITKPINWAITYSLSFNPSYNYIVAVSSDLPVLGRRTLPSDGILPEITPTLSGFAGSHTNYYLMSNNVVFNFLNKVYNNDALKTFIKNVVCLPFQPQYVSSEQSSVRVGNTDVQVQGSVIDLSGSCNRVLYATIVVPSAESFLDFEPYSTYEIYIPFKGYVNISFSENAGSTLKIYYNVDYDSGQGNYIIVNTTKGILIDMGPCNIGLRIGVDASNEREIQNQKNSLAINTGLNIVSSAISTGAGVVSGNPIATISGILTAGRTLGNTFSSSMQLYKTGSTETNGAPMGLLTPRTIYIRKTSNIKVNDANYSMLIGKPLKEVRQIKTMAGFTKVGEVHLEGFERATKTELDEIESLLKEGILA